MKRYAALAVSLAAMAGLVSCGGGGDDVVGSPAGPSAEGYYAGTLSVSGAPLPENSTAFQLLVLDGGQFWTIYGAPSGGALDVQGFAQGTGSSNGSLFVATNVRYFSVGAARTAALSANYNASAKSLSGTVVDDANSTTSLTSVPQGPTAYNYTTAATLTNVQGNWRVEGVFGDAYDLAVLPGGTFSGVPAAVLPGTATCPFTGSFAPHASGKNFFTVSTMNGGAGCPGVAGLVATGLAFVSPVTAGNQLTFATVDTTRTRGAVLSGVR
jgi:hypothetical protein